MTTHRRGSATRGAPLRCAAFALALTCLALAPRPSDARRAAAPPAAVTREPLEFAGLAWDATGADVARVLAAHGFTRAAATGEEPAAWRGEAFGRRAGLAAETDREGRLMALTLRFEPDARGSAVQRYDRLVEAVRRRHGPWTAQVAPGRGVDEERWGRFGMVRRFGPRTAATLWTDDRGAAAAVQLDGESVLWLRYESPRWEAAAREGEDAGH